MYIRRKGSLVEVEAPAKLNLFLEVLARRSDGYHEIETLMTAITIYDTLSFVPRTEGRLQLACGWSCGLRAQEIAGRQAEGRPYWGGAPEGADNIVFQAVERLRRRSGVRSGASMVLTKRIPSSAGLGGGSSDAAAALVAANLGWELGWTREQLAELGAELGSDVPFFLGASGYGSAAACRGRGERVAPVGLRAAMHFAVVRPPAGLSTAEVYGRCRVADKPARIQPLIEALQRGDMAAAGRRMVNGLQPAAERLSPWIQRIRERFDRLDCLGHQMSGSGTSYFGVCRNARHARRVAGYLRGAGWGTAYSARTVAL